MTVARALQMYRDALGLDEKFAEHLEQCEDGCSIYVGWDGLETFYCKAWEALQPRRHYAPQTVEEATFTDAMRAGLSSLVETVLAPMPVFDRLVNGGPYKNGTGETVVFQIHNDRAEDD